MDNPTQAVEEARWRVLEAMFDDPNRWRQEQERAVDALIAAVEEAAGQSSAARIADLASAVDVVQTDARRWLEVSGREKAAAYKLRERAERAEARVEEQRRLLDHLLSQIRTGERCSDCARVRELVALSGAESEATNG